ncbi:MAG: NAD(P)/FAD-dependent oxidoreductase [Cyanobacteriota bacterium]|nr:NAD(P)/FAD-dependent oxidoreductase [Cyanobacteriota bacterium]
MRAGDPQGTAPPLARPRVVVVGAGPCGGALALLLARAGWVVTLVEAAASGASRPYRGEGLMPSGLAVLEAMGLWPLPAPVRHRPLRGWAVVLERCPFFLAAEPLAADRGCWLVDQESLLAHLRMELLQERGSRVLEGQSVRGLCANGSSGRVSGVVLADGGELAADLVVACDGRHSALRRQAGLELQGEERPDGQRERVLWFRLAGAAVAPLERWLAGRFLTVVGDGLSFALFTEATGAGLRLGWVAEGGVAVPSDGAGWRECWAAALPEEAAGLLRQLPVSAIDGPQSFPVRVGWAPRWQLPGFLLLGDAAHPMSPVRAQGINMALRDALVAARQLGPLGMGPALHAELDALLPGIPRRRLPEIQQLQALQAREMGMGARLRQLGWLRRGLAATAPWSGVVARQRWIQQQHRLRQGVPEALELPE